MFRITQEYFINLVDVDITIKLYYNNESKLRIPFVLKKLLSLLFTLFVLAAVVIAAYFNQQFVLKQVNKVKGVYYVYKGDKAYKEMDMVQAIRLYNQGVKLYPAHYGAWYNLGNIYVAYEDYNSALYAYSQAFKYNPKMMIARMNYGIIASEKMGDFDAALKQYNEIIKTKRRLLSIPYVFNNKISYTENKAIAYYNIGVTYKLKSLYTGADWELQRKYLAKAIEAYKKSIKINPNSYDAQFNLGLAYHVAGDYDGAGRCYCKAISLSPMQYEAHYNLAVLLKKMGHYKEAYDEIDKATTLITALDENSSLQQYVAIVMNDITRNVYQNDEYKRYLASILEEEKQKTPQHMVKDEKEIKTKIKDNKQKGKNKDKKKSKDEVFGETLTSPGINFVNGKIVATEELDQAILENFGACPSMSYFETNSN